MITTPSVSNGGVSAAAPGPAAEFSPPAAGDFMGLLLLLMGVGIPAVASQGPGDSLMPPPGDPAKDLGPVEDQSSEPSGPAAVTEIDVTRSTVVVQPWPVPLELYAATPGVVAVNGDQAATQPQPMVSAVAPLDAGPLGAGSAAPSRGPKLQAGEGAAAPTAPTPAAQDVAGSTPEAASPALHDQSDVALHLGVSAHGYTAPDARHADATRTDPQASGTPPPALPEITRAVLSEVKPAAVTAVPAANAGAQLAAPIAPRATSNAASPDASRETPTSTATGTRETTTARHVAAPTVPIVPAVDATDPRDDRQPSAGRHRVESGIVIDNSQPYAPHGLPDLAATRSITPAPPVDAPVAPAAPRFVEQIVHTARLIVNEGVTQMDVQLEPPTLGTVRVSAAATADSIGLTLSAERPETRALLEQAIPQIQAALSVRGLTTASIAVAGNFDPPDARRAPFRREADRGGRSGQHPRERHRPASEPQPIGLVNVTV